MKSAFGLYQILSFQEEPDFGVFEDAAMAAEDNAAQELQLIELKFGNVG